jgi:hypothetical protein
MLRLKRRYRAGQAGQGKFFHDSAGRELMARPFMHGLPSSAFSVDSVFSISFNDLLSILARRPLLTNWLGKRSRNMGGNKSTLA